MPPDPAPQRGSPMGSTGDGISRRVFMGRAGRVAAGVVGATAAAGLVAACGERTTKAGTVSTADGWVVTGAATMPEVIVTTARGDAQAVAVYDAGLGLLRRGRLPAGGYPNAGGEWQAPTLSFPYLVVEGENNRFIRALLGRVDLESGADERVFTGDAGRYIGYEVAAHPTGGYVFAYSQPEVPGQAVGSNATELWSAAPGSAERIRFEDSYLAVMNDAERDWQTSLLADFRPVGVTPDGRHLLFARQHLYVLELASGKVEQLGSRYGGAAYAWLSPDGASVAVQFHDGGSSDPEAVRLAIVELSSGRGKDVKLPSPLENVDFNVGLGVWHPDGKRLACRGWADLYLRTPVRKLSVGTHSAAFIVDLGTGAATAVARDPSAPSSPPAPEDFRIAQDYRGHEPLGFSRDGRTLFVLEDYMVPSPVPTTSTSWVEENPETPRGYTRVREVVAVDVETNRRRSALSLPAGGATSLLHR